MRRIFPAIVAPQILQLFSFGFGSKLVTFNSCFKFSVARPEQDDTYLRKICPIIQYMTICLQKLPKSL